MGAGKKKRHALTRKTHSQSHMHTLMSSIQYLEGLNPANLKKLYAMLLHLSLNKSTLSCSNCESGDVELDKCGVKLVKEIYDLSDVLFKELEWRFKELFSALHDVSATWGSGNSKLTTYIWAKSEELMLLLRCCMSMLDLIEFNHNLLMEKGKLLLSVLRRLFSFELSGGGGADGNEKASTAFKRFVSVECPYVSGDCTTSVIEEFVASKSSSEPSDSCCTLLCAVLEVIADELLVHKSLREYFMLIDSASLKSEMLFNIQFSHGNIGSVLEVVCAHFVLSVSSEQGSINFINRLFWCHREDLRTPEISFPASLSLLLNPVVLSAPKMFQAYLILLVSEAIGICTSSENMMLDVQLMDWHSTAFERSVILYNRHMSSFHPNSHHLARNGSFLKLTMDGSSPLNFKSFLLQATVDKVYHLIATSKSSWDSYLSKMSCRTNSDLVASSIAYVKENICSFDESYKDEILSILNCIILGSSSDDTCNTLFLKGETSFQDIYLLASILKLMSSSMLQAIQYMRFFGISGCQKSSTDFSSSKEYNYLVHILGCFQQFSIHLPIQNFLNEMMQSHSARHKDSKWMLLHLSGLLSLSYASGIDFLVKGCLFTMMMLLNLFIIEEGDLSALRSLCGSRSKSYSSKSPDNVEEVMVVRKSTELISSKFQKIQDTYLRTRSHVVSDKRKQDNQAETSEYSCVLNGLDSAVTVASNTEEICNGEMFLKCILGKNSKEPDFDDLADFVACKPGKDYSDWLKGREKLRQRKYKKMIKLRWKKKKSAWNSMR
ncbi:uncharacterized protein LOC8269754 [Ricinus communis]|uniref:uncharacterized protein LOC8269754 n=1 Tax=Ricinus communis TaxID=3988 RepID=UPI00201A955A|nr:uncharacterized protein LOC8269754 [Ricinus communis]